MLIMAAWAYREGIEWASLKQALLGAAIFLPIGLFLFEAVSLDWLVRGTGLAILGMVLVSLRNQKWHPNAQASKGSCFLAGAVGGFLAGAVSIAGPPVAAFALKQDWSQARFKAFVTQCLLVIVDLQSGAVDGATLLCGRRRLADRPCCGVRDPGCAARCDCQSSDLGRTVQTAGRDHADLGVMFDDVARSGGAERQDQRIGFETDLGRHRLIRFWFVVTRFIGCCTSKAEGMRSLRTK